MNYYTRNLEFPKSGADIKAKAEEKIQALKAKVEERKKLIAENAKMLGIESVEDALTRADELGIELTADQNIAHTKLLSNRGKVRDEKREIRELEMVVRNLPDDRSYDLDFDSLSYFGF